MSKMSARHWTILSVLNDIKDAFLTLLQKPNKQPALLVMYAFIDICAALARKPSTKVNRNIFMEYVEDFATPGAKRVLPPKQLWQARSSLLHTFSPLGRESGSRRSRPIFYYAWDENKDQVRERLQRQG